MGAETGMENGKQKITTKAIMYRQATALTTYPTDPLIQNQPGAISDRRLSRCGRMAARYDILDSTTKESIKALKATWDPR